MLTPVHPRFIPPPYQDAPDRGRLILRDGSAADLRPATPADCPALTNLFLRLSAESHYQRFHTLSTPSPELIARLCSAPDPKVAITLVATRTQADEPRIIATGTYVARDENTAEVALVVEDTFQGKGLGTLLLERLALLAAQNGFANFWALTSSANRAMLDVFRTSGFVVRERAEGTDIELTLSVTPTEASVSGLELRDRIATVASLLPLFKPRSVAVVGASREPAAIGYRILDALVKEGFAGPIYPVNPKASTIAGVKAYPSVSAIPGPVDLAVIAVPSAAVLGVVDDCAARGVRALVVITAGFAEVGGAGVELQHHLLAKVRGHGMRMVGPNCLGILNADPAVRLNASFSPIFPESGRIAMSSQSGAVGLAALGFARRYGLGFSTFVSVGNKADVSGNDLLQYWEEDTGTGVILLYLESFGNPRRFSRIARRVGRRKPVVVLFSGRTAAGSRAAGSHTAALAASPAALDALFHQTGVIRAGSLEEMFDLALALGDQPLPRGRRVGIVTNAGGPGILCADACEAAGLRVPEVSPDLRAKLHSLLPHAASVGNPIDLIAAAGAEEYQRGIEALLTSGEVDALVVIYTPVGLAEGTAIEDAIGKAIAASRERGSAECPVLASIVGQEGSQAHMNVPTGRIPTYPFPEAPARALGKMASYAAWRQHPPEMFPEFEDIDIPRARDLCRLVLAERGPGWLSYAESVNVLAAFGLPLVPGAMARSAEEAGAAATRLGFPVAVKLASRQLVHKTEVGGVHLGLADAAAVERAFHEIRIRLERDGQSAAMEGVIVQPMVSGGVEVMAGLTHDPLFGSIVAFGLGGIHVEVLADISFRAAPLSDRDAGGMIRDIRGFRLLEGYRGHPPGDVAAIEEALLRLSRLGEEVPEIAAIDLNPIMAFPPGKGCMIADARVQLRASGRKP